MTSPSELTELTEDLAEILGMPCFRFIQLATLYREAGHEIAYKAEAEQAFFIHKMLMHYIGYGEDWRSHYADEIQMTVNIAKEKREAALNLPT